MDTNMDAASHRDTHTVLLPACTAYLVARSKTREQQKLCQPTWICSGRQSTHTICKFQLNETPGRRVRATPGHEEDHQTGLYRLLGSANVIFKGELCFQNACFQGGDHGNLMSTQHRTRKNASGGLSKARRRHQVLNHNVLKGRNVTVISCLGAFKT